MLFFKVNIKHGVRFIHGCISSQGEDGAKCLCNLTVCLDPNFLYDKEVKHSSVVVEALFSKFTPDSVLLSYY